MNTAIDDRSQNEKPAKESDREIAAACESAGLTLLRIKAARAYSVANLNKSNPGPNPGQALNEGPG